jgi:ribonuclease HII
MMENVASKKRILVGADEAGYGPNLGPLLIAASAWAIPDEMTTEAFSNALGEVFSPRPWKLNCSHLPIGDSKKLFQPAIGLANLEAGLLALLRICFPRTSDLAQLMLQTSVNSLAFDKWMADRKVPWYEDLQKQAVPSCLAVAEIERLSQVASAHLAKHEIEFLGVRARVITEHCFNQSVEKLNSKGQLLSLQTLELVHSFCDEADCSVEIFCDRQGGRKNYLPILLEVMPDEWFIEQLRSPKRSSYRNTRQPLRHIHFTVGGDSFVPTSLASMLAKYLRERLMNALNAYWRTHLPSIHPTAGYPLDANRFRNEISVVARENHLPEDLWWRSR